MMENRAEPFDPQTGEILDPIEPVQRAADGAIVPLAARTTGQFLDQIGEGDFSRRAYHEVTELGQKIKDLAERTGRKQKGKVTITLEMSSEGEMFELRPEIKVTAPKEPSKLHVAWQDDSGNFTRFPPNQMQMFGVRQGGGAAAMRPVKMD